MKSEGVGRRIQGKTQKSAISLRALETTSTFIPLLACGLPNAAALFAWTKSVKKNMYYNLNYSSCASVSAVLTPASLTAAVVASP